MALDIKFRQRLQNELGKTLSIITKNKNSKSSKIWKCKNDDDFLYGWHLGKVDGFCLNQYFIHYHKTPTKEDLDEIQGMLFLHANDFRRKLYE
jgi:hypothetical protein